MKRIVPLFLLALFMLAPCPSRANTEEGITAQFSGSQPYMLVHKDDTDKSQREPGLYLRDGSDWKLLFPGSVLVDPRRGPVFHQLQIAEVDNRLPAVTVVDGAIRLFHVLSTPDVPESFLTLGGDQPITELATGTKRLIPAISDAEQISVVQFPIAIFPKRNTQLVLISIKNTAPSGIANSDGLTIALRLKNTPDQTIVLDGPPMVIDNRFHIPSVLQGMVSRNSQNQPILYSDILQQAFLGRISVENYGEYRQPVGNLISRQSQCQTGNTGFCPIAELAHWNLETGVPHYNDTISFHWSLQKTYISLRQNWPLMSGAPVATASIPNGALVTLNGRLRLNGSNVVWATMDDRSSASPVLFAVEDDLYLGVANGTEIKVAKIESLGGRSLPTQVSLTHYTAPGQDDTSRLRVIISRTDRKPEADLDSTTPEDFQSKTIQYVLAFAPGSDHLSIENTIQLSDAFYTHAELYERLYTREKSRGFDNQTAVQGDRNRYLQAREETSPYVDLINSKDSGDLQYIFPAPILEENVANDLTYRQYKYGGVGKNPTGLYFEAEGGSETFLEGTLLKDEAKKSFDLLNQGTPILSPALGEINARLFALDPTNRDGNFGFNVAVHIAIRKNDRTENSFSQIQNFSSTGRSGLVATRLVSGRRQNSGNLFAIYFFTNKVYYSPLVVHPTESTIQVEKLRALPFADNLGPDEFIQRLVYDQNGILYFILTPGVSPNSREFGVLNLQTNTRVFPKREYGGNGITFDFGTNMTDLFHSISDDSPLSWKVLPFRKEVNEAVDSSNSAKDLAKSALFAKFRDLLSEAADPQQPARRRIFVVPDEIKSLAMEFVRQSYLVRAESEVTDNSRFHRFNRNLGLYIFDPNRAEPSMIFENFEIAKSRPADRSVVVADIADLIATDRPVSKGSEHGFMLQIPEPGTDEQGEPTVDYKEVTPHVMYLMATGAPVGYEDFRKAPPAPIATTIFVGTEAELNTLKVQAAVEVDAGLDKAFEIIELPPPTMNSKTEMLDELMARPNIKGLGFEFDASGISDTPATDQLEAQQKIFEYAVTRAEAIARPKGENSFTAFVQFQKLFGEKILTDPIVRNSRRIDRSFVERILTLQFNLPLNLADLAVDDPLRILSGEDAPFRMQRAGMLGEFELKAEIIRLSLAQLNHDPARVMPSTWIWAGEPGTGKTKAWQALVEMLGLKLYVRGDSKANKDANAFYLDTVRVKKGRDSAAAIEEALNELNDFISTPNGSRGFIFIDDLHFADDDFGKAIVQWIRSLQQSEKGVARIKRSNGEVVSIAVQNLTIGIAMNFSDNKAQLGQFSGDDVSALVSKIIATGSRFGIDKSFVDRFGGVYNFDKFHESVKEPSLNEGLLEAAQKKLARTGQFVIVDPEFVRMAAKAFPNMGARPFLSKSTEAIISQPDQLQLGRSKVFALIPKSETEIAQAASETTSKTTGAWGQESAEVKSWVHAHSHVIELEQGQAAPLMLMRLMIPSFRSPILEALVYAMQTDVRLKSDRLSRGYFLAPTLFAAYDHLTRAETIPLKDLKLDETRFNVKTKSESAEFETLINELSVSSSPFVTAFPTSGGRLSLWSELGLGGARTSRTDSRKDVLLNYTNKIHAVVERHLHRVLNVESLKEMDDVEAWLRNLPEKVPFDSEGLGRELNELLLQFLKDFHAHDLREALPGSGSKAMEPYVAGRFFFMALDKALIRLPWDDLGQKMVSALKLITQDKVLGQSVGVQNWLFNPKNRASLLKPTTTNLIREMVEFNSTVRETAAEGRASLKSSFESSCESYLSDGSNR